MITRQFKVQTGKIILFILSRKGKRPTLAGNKHLSVHFFLHRPRFFRLPTGNVRVQSLRKWHQSGYSSANTININMNKRWKKFSIIGGLKMQSKNLLKTLNKVHINARKVHVYLWLHFLLIKSTLGNKSRLFPSPFHFSASWRLTLAGTLRSDYVAACGTALHSATEKNGSGDYVTVTCPSKVKQHISTVDWLIF